MFGKAIGAYVKRGTSKRAGKRNSTYEFRKGRERRYSMCILFIALLVQAGASCVYVQSTLHNMRARIREDRTPTRLANASAPIQLPFGLRRTATDLTPLSVMR